MDLGSTRIPCQTTAGRQLESFERCLASMLEYICIADAPAVLAPAPLSVMSADAGAPAVQSTNCCAGVGAGGQVGDDARACGAAHPLENLHMCMQD